MDDDAKPAKPEIDIHTIAKRRASTAQKPQPPVPPAAPDEPDPEGSDSVDD